MAKLIYLYTTIPSPKKRRKREPMSRLRFSTLTLEINAHPKAPYGYYYAPTGFTSRLRSDPPQAFRRPGAVDADDDGARHDVRAVPLG